MLNKDQYYTGKQSKNTDMIKDISNYTFEEIETFLEKKCMNGDLLITMGAGDVVNIGENLLRK